MEPHELPEKLTVAQVAKLFGVTPRTIRNWADRGYIECVRTLGPRADRRFSREHVAELLRPDH